MSNSKTHSSIVMSLLWGQGLFKYEDLVSKHWPEFGASGKESMTIADVFRHEAGLSLFPESVQLEDTLVENIKKNHMG